MKALFALAGVMMALSIPIRAAPDGMEIAVQNKDKEVTQSLSTGKKNYHKNDKKNLILPYPLKVAGHVRLAEVHEEDGLDNVLRGDGLGSTDLAKDSAELQVQEVAPSLFRLLQEASNPSTGTEPSSPSTGAEDDDEFEERYTMGIGGVSGIVDGVIGVIDADDGTKWSAWGSLIKSFSPVVQAALPPPFGIIAGTAVSVIGSLFGLGDKDPTTNEDILKAMAENFNKVFERLDEIENALQKGFSDVEKSLNKMTEMMKYNTEIVAKTYQELVMDPFESIHAAYTNLMEIYVPKSADMSWDYFFDKAIMIRHELDREAFDAFDTKSIKDFLQWFENEESINGMGMCGQAVEFQFINMVRFELLQICLCGSFIRRDGCDGKSLNCWIPDIAMQGSYLENYVEQMNGWNLDILNPVRMGGLGIAHLVGQSLSKSDVRIAKDGAKLGKCFRCKKSSENGCSKRYGPVKEEVLRSQDEGFALKNLLPDMLQCDPGTAFECCSCSCLHRSEYKGSFESTINTPDDENRWYELENGLKDDGGSFTFDVKVHGTALTFYVFLGPSDETNIDLHYCLIFGKSKFHFRYQRWSDISTDAPLTDGDFVDDTAFRKYRISWSSNSVRIEKYLESSGWSDIIEVPRTSDKGKAHTIGHALAMTGYGASGVWKTNGKAYGGTIQDHEMYDRHCEDDESIYYTDELIDKYIKPGCPSADNKCHLVPKHDFVKATSVNAKSKKTVCAEFCLHYVYENLELIKVNEVSDPTKFSCGCYFRNGELPSELQLNAKQHSSCNMTNPATLLSASSNIFVSSRKMKKVSNQLRRGLDQYHLKNATDLSCFEPILFSNLDIISRNDRQLILGEVEALDQSGFNVALMQPATQSSTFSESDKKMYPASNAVNGDVTTGSKTNAGMSELGK